MSDIERADLLVDGKGPDGEVRNERSHDVADPDYRYDHFRMRHMLRDMRFSSSALRPGDHFEPIELCTADGSTIQLGGPRAKPLVLVSGSLTCPMTESSTPTLRQLHAELGDRADFVLLSVREAHPGEHLPQPADDATATDRARRLADHHQIPFPVAIDAVEGTVHHRLDDKPNAVLVLDQKGRVAYRGLWAAAHEPLRAAIEDVAGGRTPQTTDDRSMLGPMTSALPGIPMVMARGGPQARRDLRRSAPPMALAGRLARSVPLASSRGRSLVAMAILAAVMVAMVVVLAVVLVGLLR